MNGKYAEWLLYLYAESPVHAGAADSSGVVDLAIQREATTGYPVIWGQSLKGALRQAARDAGWDETLGEEYSTGVFGSDPTDGREQTGDGGQGKRSATAGALSVGDAQLVALPVPTLRHTFAWATSDLALARLARKYRALPNGTRKPLLVPTVADDVGVAAHSAWLGHKTDEVLGPLKVAFGGEPSEQLAAWADRLAVDAIGEDDAFGAFAKKMRRDLLLVGQDVMPELSRSCTEVTARVQLNEGKTVEHGPFYSEYLPAESVLAASLSLRNDNGFADLYEPHLRELLSGKLHQIGGDETLGKGLVWCRLIPGSEAKASAAGKGASA